MTKKITLNDLDIIKNINNEGCLMKIIEYNKAIDIIVEFQDEYKAKVHTTYNNFKKGNVKNPYHPSVFDVGYIGQDKHKASENRKSTKIYKAWQNMLQRCYNPYAINKRPTYINCYVCDEWLNFQNFAEWYEENYYEINNERMNLDKDILCKGNKIYSPENCVFVPQRINELFVKSNKIRGDYPIGVSWHKNRGKFQVACSVLENDKKKIIYLGLYNSLLEAFEVYKRFKENYIKQVADEYKDLIPIELYNALYKYKVEIND